MNLYFRYLISLRVGMNVNKDNVLNNFVAWDKRQSTFDIGIIENYFNKSIIQEIYYKSLPDYIRISLKHAVLNLMSIGQVCRPISNVNSPIIIILDGVSKLSRALRDPLPQRNPSRSFSSSNAGDDGVHNGNVKRVVDSQRSSLSFGTGREFVSVDVNLRDWNVEGERRGLIAFSFPFCNPPNKTSLYLSFIV